MRVDLTSVALTCGPHCIRLTPQQTAEIYAEYMRETLAFQVLNTKTPQKHYITKPIFISPSLKPMYGHPMRERGKHFLRPEQPRVRFTAFSSIGGVVLSLGGAGGDQQDGNLNIDVG